MHVEALAPNMIQMALDEIIREVPPAMELVSSEVDRERPELACTLSLCLLCEKTVKNYPSVSQE